jgi:hypothetical protein
VAPTSDWICCAGEASVDPGPRALQPGDRDRRRSAGGDRCNRTPTEAALHGAWIRGTRAVGPGVARRCAAVDMARGARVNKISLNPLGSGGCVRPGPLSGPYREHPRDWGGSGRLLFAPAAHRAGLIARTSRQPGGLLGRDRPNRPGRHRHTRVQEARPARRDRARGTRDASIWPAAPRRPRETPNWRGSKTIP